MDSSQLYNGMDSIIESLKTPEPQPSDIIALNNQERELINRFFENMRVYSPETMVGVAARIMDLERLSVSISRYPSMYEQSSFSGQERSIRTLLDTLCTLNEGGKLLFLPTKAILGQGFLVAKFHAFSAITKVAKNSFFPEQSVKELYEATVNVMFTLMAEDVYMSLLDDPNLRDDVRHDVAESLADLWEHRLDPNASKVAPVLDAVWAARNRIVPNFGTMIGTSELLLLSIELDDTWNKFISERIAVPDVASSMEEFLFGLSYEDISLIREELKNRKNTAVGREDVEGILGHKTGVKANEDPRIFYQAYTKRRNNASARKKLGVKGPWKTLEDHYMQFIFEKNREHKNDGNGKKNLSRG